MIEITLGNNFKPPIVNQDLVSSIYELIRSDDLEIENLNSLLLSVVVYLEAHGVNFNDGNLPWVEVVNSTKN
jgi:hypothetical protein